MDALVFRIEWKDKGPFWDDTNSSEIEAQCRKITKDHRIKTFFECVTFLSHYVTYAPNPHEHRVMEEYLCLDRHTGVVGFGFNSVKILHEQLGLGESLYELQFKSLFKTGYFKVKAYLAQCIAYNETETMFRRSTAQLVEEASSTS